MSSRRNVAPDDATVFASKLVVAAAENGPDDFSAWTVFGNAGDGQRRSRFAAHRVDVAERVGGGDLAVRIRVVHDRGEEINGLHQRGSRRPSVHTRIVRGPVVDKDAVVIRARNVTQHVGELACGEFARSTGAGDELGQTALLRGRVGHLLQPCRG